MRNSPNVFILRWDGLLTQFWVSCCGRGGNPHPFLISGAAAVIMLSVFLFLRMGNGKLITRARRAPTNPIAFLGRFFITSRALSQDGSSQSSVPVVGGPMLFTYQFLRSKMD